MSNTASPFPMAEVRMLHGRPALVVNGEPIPPMYHTASFRATCESAKKLADAGIRVYFLWVDSGWYKPDDWENVADEIRTILSVNPDAYFVMRTACYPPDSWMDANPAELETFEDGSTDHFDNAYVTYGTANRMVCLASDKYARTTGEYLARFEDFIRSSSFGHRVIGYFLVGGGTGEWYYSNMIEGGSSSHVFGFSPAFKRFYSGWLREKYGELGALRTAWNDESASFDNPKIPGKKEQLLTNYKYPERDEGRLTVAGDYGNFIDPDKGQSLADFYEARTAGTAATIEYLAKVIKDKTSGQALVGAFWGNLGTTLATICSVSGPLMLADSPYLDFFSSPSNYEDRIPGGGATFRTGVDSICLRGKLWINESDSRTLKSTYTNKVGFGGTYTLDDTVGTLKRDFAQVLCEDVQGFWFDMEPGEHSFYDDPDVLALFKRQQELSQEYYETGRGKVSEIAVVYDQDSLWYVDSEVSKDFVWLNRDFNLPRIGAPCDHIFVDDLRLEQLPDYKMYVFMNCFHIDSIDRKAIEARVKLQGKTAVWVYAAGLMNPDSSSKMDLDNMSDLTGFRFGVEEGAREGTFRIPDAGHELTANTLHYAMYGGYERPLLNHFEWKRGLIRMLYPTLNWPLFYVSDDDATVLGRFITNDQPAYALKSFPDWQSIYIGAKSLNPVLLRNIARAAGVHIYLDTDDIVYANGRFLSVHAAVEDRKRICLPRVFARITDAYTNELVASNAKEFEIPMRNGETAMFRLE